jgi:hypothetical protein
VVTVGRLAVFGLGHARGSLESQALWMRSSWLRIGF